MEQYFFKQPPSPQKGQLSSPSTVLTWGVCDPWALPMGCLRYVSDEYFIVVSETTCHINIRLRQTVWHFADAIIKCIHWMKIIVFWAKFHSSLFPQAQLKITQYFCCEMCKTPQLYIFRLCIYNLRDFFPSNLQGGWKIVWILKPLKKFECNNLVQPISNIKHLNKRCNCITNTITTTTKKKKKFLEDKVAHIYRKTDIVSPTPSPPLPKRKKNFWRTR